MYGVSIENVTSGYRDVKVLHDVSLEAEEGRVTVILGANGAGKSTLIKTTVGLLAPTAGSIKFGSRDTTHWPAHKKATLGMALVPEGRGIFQKMSVRENLEMGAYLRWDPRRVRAEIDRVFDRFPILKERERLPGGMLSGGEQQMLTIARALVGNPELLVLDEPSLGLAPQTTRTVFNLIREINQSGVTVLLAEQNAAEAQKIADKVYLMELGRIVGQGTPEQMAGDDVVLKSFLGQRALVE